MLPRDRRTTGREKRFLVRFLAGEALALGGLAVIYFAFPDAVVSTFIGVGWQFFPYVSYYVGLVVGLGPDFSPVGAAPGIDAYDIAGVLLWVAGGSILFAWPASLLLAVWHRKRFGL